MRLITATITSVLLFMTTTHVVSAGLITNGGFEFSTNGLPNDWNTSGNMVVVDTQGETEGSWALAFSYGNRPPTGDIWQSFATHAGTTYSVTFDFGKFSIGQPNAGAVLVVSLFDGESIAGINLIAIEAFRDSTPGQTFNSTDSPDVYSSFSLQFTAQSSRSTLRFRDASDEQSGPGGFDAMLDNVAVNVVPEPSTLLLAACGMVSGLVGGRRTRTASRDKIPS